MKFDNPRAEFLVDLFVYFDSKHTNVDRQE